MNPPLSSGYYFSPPHPLSQGLHLLLHSNQVKRTPLEYINVFIIQKLNPLPVVDFRLISAFLYVLWAVNSHARQLWNFYQLHFPEIDVNVF